VSSHFQNGNKKIKLFRQYENETQRVLFFNAVPAAFTSGRKYEIIPQNGDYFWVFETESVIKIKCRYKTRYGKDPISDNAIRRWLKQFQETGSVLHRKVAGRLSISQEDVDRNQEAFSRSPQKSTAQFLVVRYTTNNYLEGCSFYRQ
jgi:hypothetical protein